eukprot:TRINITY_DN1911_c0_g3_i1.p1 TRINITY_DN1911_c0_g3~~TRINITY_DN1911_c0_g3_i1.p1  ORF type:complete len:415 (+),score=78.92 TRINITY_DN1911_c0_g3_i1:82-1326(+)
MSSRNSTAVVTPPIGGGPKRFGNTGEKASSAPLVGKHRFYVCQKCRKSFRLKEGGGLSKGTEQCFQWLEEAVDGELTANEMHQTVSALLQYAADKVNTDLPLCRECCELVSWGPGGFAEKLKSNTTDSEVYQSKLEELQREPSEKEEVADSELEELKKVEAELLEALKQAEAEDRTVQAELDAAESDRKAMEEEVERFWGNLSDLAVAETDLKETSNKLERQLTLHKADLTRLTNTNILNQAFHIWFDGHYGTINKLRLGKLQSQPVEQNEVNAAWGYAAQLLVILLRIWGVRTSRYKVIPKGSFSIVQKYGSKTNQNLELWSGATGLWASTRYDNAVMGFACCIDELCRNCLAMFPNEKRIPYPINDDLVGGLSVKMAASQTDENWTRALKFLLLDLKWAVCMTTSRLRDEYS